MSMDLEIKDNNMPKDVNNKDGSIGVVNGRIVVNNPEGHGEPAYIIPSSKLFVFVSGEKVQTKTDVFSYTDVTYEIPEKVALRNMKVLCKDNEMKAILSVSYEPGIRYKLKDQQFAKFTSFDIEKKEEILPPLYTREEIEKALVSAGISYGIDREVIEAAMTSYDFTEGLVAEGLDPVAPVPDKVDIKFKIKPPKFKEDLKGNVDYKSIGQIVSVEPGQLLAQIIEGNQGSDGVSVRGKIIKVPKPKPLKIVCGSGCEQFGNQIKSTLKGKPLYNGGKFSVSELHEVRSNVDLSTGNIKFSGHVVVYGHVLEGMEVEGTAGVEIYKSVANSVIKSNGNIEISGNSLLSNINAGGIENANSIIREKMKSISISLEELYGDCMQIEKQNTLGQPVRPGELIKILLERKFRNLTNKVSDFLRVYLAFDNCNKKLYINLKMRLLGGGPLTIEKYDVLQELIIALNDEIHRLVVDNSSKADIKLSYCQDSVINATGNVYINGRGQYQSNIMAGDSVYITGIRSVSRGGIIQAGNIIKCNFIGSDAGVKTELKVDKQGEIFANFAYHNTKFTVGTYQYTLEKPSKDIHVYLSSNGELMVDKFNA
ncbi:hypothetical protein SAMN02745248_00713 [Hathewaya proteolytica DSM 3090]|uniref:Flagellar Assembly Protein A N-terminal region domain-containing protein n=1 Tax=Hathewaya proteolytica DSM 3090 TaxID=1121331 RepID=A0A1M6LCW0_9CLOT|nr:FapA family protein [Hathewaya proteolytica]SHJ69024.1 hypothetical protein SAMN02745248_00713 [Hathewaya proteolytica DSM 3090]